VILSIIIPVYNVEKYVERCIRSCEAQDIASSDFELIIVNDGSKDNSLQIVDNVAKEFDNISIISQPNAGLSAARNTGMRNAQGDYYMFVDSDDWIAENCVGKLVDKLKNENPDCLAICAADFVDGLIKRRQNYHNETPTTGPKLLINGVEHCATFSIWRADFFAKNNLLFYKGILHEDAELIPRAYYLAEKVSYTNDIIYYVFPNPTSITRSVNSRKSFDLVDVVCTHLSEFSITVNDDHKVMFHNMISIFLNNALANIIGASKDQIERLNDDIYCHKTLFEHLAKSNITKYRFEAILFKLFPKHTFQVYKLVQLANNKR